MNYDPVAMNSQKQRLVINRVCATGCPIKVSRPRRKKSGGSFFGICRYLANLRLARTKSAAGLPALPNPLRYGFALPTRGEMIRLCLRCVIDRSCKPEVPRDELLASPLAKSINDCA